MSDAERGFGRILGFLDVADEPGPAEVFRTRGSYERLVADARRAVSEVVPFDATVAVVSKGDERLVEIEGRTAWHFPRDLRGAYAGHDPVDAAQAIGHLEEVWARGADFFVLPATERWWLEDDDGLRQHLERRYRTLLDDERCIVFAL